MGEMIYKPLIEDMTWSYSRIDSFNTCRYKWFLHYIDDPEGKNAQPMFYASYGSFMHKIIEDYYKGKIKKENLVTEFLLNYQDEVQGKRPMEKIAQNYINYGIEYLTNFKEFPYEMVDVEKEVHFTLNGNKFIGFIDFVGMKDGDIYIVDNKSRELKPRSKRNPPTKKDEELDEMLKQLYLYSQAVYEIYGKYPKALCFNCFRNQVFIEEPFIMEEFEKAVKWATESIEEIKNTDDFYPNVEYFFCHNLCEYYPECVYAGGAD